MNQRHVTVNAPPPPDDDEKITRHQFYAAITAALENNTTAMNQLSDKLKTLGTQHLETAQEFRDLKTVTKTIAALASFFSIVLGGGVTLILKNAWSYTERVEVLERAQEISALKGKPLESLPDSVTSLSNRVTTLENEHRLAERERAKSLSHLPP